VLRLVLHDGQKVRFRRENRGARLDS
jgi:hypothetical protein